MSGGAGWRLRWSSLRSSWSSSTPRSSTSPCPRSSDDLGFAQENLQWVITAYAIMFGGTLLLGGRLADLFGRRRTLLVGLAIFSFSSLFCGLAWSGGSLIAFRAAQGLGAALLAPAALALLLSTFAEGRQRNLALGIYGAASGSGAAVGVLLGGLLTTYLSWPWIFLVNVPVGVGASHSRPFYWERAVPCCRIAISTSPAHPRSPPASCCS
jgi:MFS family permease